LALLTGKSFHFLNSKSESLFQQRKNPRKIAWTVLYRRKHRKGITAEDKKRKTRKTTKFVRGIEVCSEQEMHDVFLFASLHNYGGPVWAGRGGGAANR